MSKIFLSTAIPYVNAPPHLGFGLEVILADVLARSWRERGEEVFFLTGTDENSLKSAEAAEKAGLPTKTLVDQNAARFRELKDILNISFDEFLRTTEERHTKGVADFWQRCRNDIYKKRYRGLYCLGCETFYTEKDLIDGLCPEHKTKPELVEEENYFFKLSNYQTKLQDFIASGRLQIVPESRKNEVLSFIEAGLEDISISRSAKRAKGWGIPVPGDPEQIIWVWFDALPNYLTAPGIERWRGYDQVNHLIGKGVLRFHAVYWPAMLLSAGLRLPNRIFVHGYLTIDGQKISKSLGNVIEPAVAAEKYGTDALRYYLLREVPSTEDGDFSYEKFEERYNSDLADGLGNFNARVVALAQDGHYEYESGIKQQGQFDGIKNRVFRKIEEFKFHEALSGVWQLIAQGNRLINEKRIWENRQFLPEAVAILYTVKELLASFLPETAEKIGREKILFPKK